MKPTTFTELLELPGVEEQLSLGSTFGFCAYHGGNLERRTDVIAAEAAALAGASYYGVVQPLDMHWHLTSTLVKPSESTTFAQFMDHCDVVVTVHGYGRQNYFTSLLCGGANRPLARHVASTLRPMLDGYQLVDDIDEIPSGLRGLHPRNPCNLARGGGMQLELPPRVRGLSPKARVRSNRDGTLDDYPDLRQLIDGLAQAALTWSTD